MMAYKGEDYYYGNPISDMTNKKVVAIIQARTGSTRLPNKILEILKDVTVLEHVVNRMRLSQKIDDIVIATTTNENDDKIVALCKDKNIDCVRGSENNVLERYYNAAVKFDADIIVRITSDCPLIDPYIADEVVSVFLEGDYDIVYNGGLDLAKRTYPRGLDVEVFSFEMLQLAYKNSNLNYQLEHVTPYIYEYSNKKFLLCDKVNNSSYRWTLDTEEDLSLIQKIYDKLYEGEHNFFYFEIMQLMYKYPDLKEINAHIEQKKIY